MAPRNLKATARSRSDRVRLLGVDAEVLHSSVEYAAFDLAVHEKFVERGDGDETRIDLEEIAKRGAAFAAAEAIGPERSQSAGHPLADHVGQGLQIIRRR